MKKFLLLAGISIAGLLTYGQDGQVINDKNAEQRSVQHFHAIRISGGIDLYLTQDSKEGLAISAKDESVRSHIKTTVENGELVISIDRDHFWSGKSYGPMKAYVAFHDLDKLVASGGSDVYIINELKSPNLDVSLSGGSDMKGRVAIGNLNIVQSGGSDVHIKGTAGAFAVHASGGSDVDGYDLVTDNCRIDASGGSDVHITANKELSINASGGSDVYYKGSAALRDVHSSGSSDIVRKG